VALRGGQGVEARALGVVDGEAACAALVRGAELRLRRRQAVRARGGAPDPREVLRLVPGRAARAVAEAQGVDMGRTRTESGTRWGFMHAPGVGDRTL
jgi:hypothetical protein